MCTWLLCSRNEGEERKADVFARHGRGLKSGAGRGVHWGRRGGEKSWFRYLHLSAYMIYKKGQFSYILEKFNF